MRRGWLAGESFILPSHNPCEDSGTGYGGGGMVGGKFNPTYSKVEYSSTVLLPRVL